VTVPVATRPETGLSADEVADGVVRGLVNDVSDRPSRTLGQIVRADVLTRFNPFSACCCSSSSSSAP